MDNIKMTIIKHDKELSEQDIQAIEKIGQEDPPEPVINPYFRTSTRGNTFRSNYSPIFSLFGDQKTDIDFNKDLDYLKFADGSYELNIDVSGTKYEGIFSKIDIGELSFLFDDDRTNSFEDLLKDINKYTYNYEIGSSWIDIEIKINYGIGEEEFTITLFEEEESDEISHNGGFGDLSLLNLDDFIKTSQNLITSRKPHYLSEKCINS